MLLARVVKVIGSRGVACKCEENFRVHSSHPLRKVPKFLTFHAAAGRVLKQKLRLENFDRIQSKVPLHRKRSMI